MLYKLNKVCCLFGWLHVCLFVFVPMYVFGVCVCVPMCIHVDMYI